MRGWDGVKYDSDKSYDRSHVSEKFFESFVPGNVKHRSKKFPSSLFLPFIKQFRRDRTGKWKFSFEILLLFSGNRLDVYRSRFFDSKPVPFRNVLDRADIRMIDACQQSIYRCGHVNHAISRVLFWRNKIIFNFFQFLNRIGCLFIMYFMVGLNLIVKSIYAYNRTNNCIKFR